ncbi:MAG: hypothetical protein JKY89_02475 [Immundisolibacteraceae bacterium]|nr:hypothetical protein [Immundisolibacteraceae bacterium]
MTVHKNKCVYPALLLLSGLATASHGMGLRSFVALPVETGGAVVRLTYQRQIATDTEQFVSSLGYGISSHQTLLLGLPYRLSPTGNNRQGDLSLLYRHIVWRADRRSGTDRLGLLAGALLPTETNRDSALQSGLVFTHFHNRHEIDIDLLYQSGQHNRANSGRYDLSWQYRLLPDQRPDWGIAREIWGVVEFNGRWQQGKTVTQQITAGLQWIHPKLVIEGGIVRDINRDHSWRYLLSTRFHF